jgi:hypothetical protein
MIKNESQPQKTEGGQSIARLRYFDQNQKLTPWLRPAPDSIIEI